MHATVAIAAVGKMMSPRLAGSGPQAAHTGPNRVSIVQFATIRSTLQKAIVNRMPP